MRLIDLTGKKFGECNRWKSDMSEVEFYEHVNRIASLKRGMAAAAGGK